jgi:hypothetical protein
MRNVNLARPRALNQKDEYPGNCQNCQNPDRSCTVLTMRSSL